MKRLDLIIENLEYAKLVKETAHRDELLEEAPMKIISTFESGCYVTADYLANEIRSRK